MTAAYDDLNNTQNVGTGSSVSAAWFDKARDNLEHYATGPGAHALSNATTNVSSGTVTAVAFAAADLFDTDGYHSTSSNNTRITVPSGLGGRYLCVGYVALSANASGSRQAHFRVNGSAVRRCVSQANAASQPWETTLTSSILLSVGDYVELIVFQDSGSTLTVSGSMSMEWTGR